MPNVRMPDGVVVRFPDEMPPEQIKALIAQKFPQAAAGPAGGAAMAASAKPAPRATDTYLSQGLSGFNEGVGNILGFPVDATTMAMNAGMSGVNTLFGTDLQHIQNPIGGSDFLKSTILAPTISPESPDKGQQFARRVGQEIGAMAIPGMGPVVRSTMPLKTLGAELAAATGSGVGAGIAEQVAPDNPLAEFAGQTLGGLTPWAAGRAVTRPPKPPSIDDLRTQKNAAYAAADNMGVTYQPQEFDNMLADIAQDVTSAHISPTRHARAASFIRDMMGRRGKPMTLTELDQLRQEVRRDLITPSYSNPEAAADAFFGDMILDNIDDMIAKSPGGSAAMLKAREANTRLRKSEMLEDAITKAVRRTQSTGSGGNINNAIRQNVRQILDNPKRRKAFTKEELVAMEDLVRQGKMENFLRLVGKLSPSGNGLMAALGIGGTMINPSIGLASLAGAGAKAMADSGTINKAIALQNKVGGVPTTKSPMAQALLRRGGQNLLPQLANNNGLVEVLINGGAQ